MSYRYDFSIVLFAEKEQQLKTTCASLQQQTCKADRVQTILVLLGDKLDSCETVRKLEKNENVVVICAKGADDLSTVLFDKVEGEYVTFAKGGIIYDAKALASIQKMARKKNADVVFGSIKNKEKINNMIHEHNVYCDRHHGSVSLKKDIRILHNMYFAYFLHTEKICREVTVLPDKWSVGVLKLLYATIFTSERIACIRQICVYTANGSQAITGWDELLKSDIGRTEFVENFLKEMEKLVFEKGVLHRDNAEYVLAYYCYRLSGFQATMGMQRDVQTTAEVERVLGRIKNATAIIQNRYIKQIYKHYILMNFFPQVNREDSEETRFILSPEYKEVRFYFFEKKQEKLHIEFSMLMLSDSDYEVSLHTGKEQVVCEEAFEFAPVIWGQQKIGTYRMYTADLPWENLERELQVVIDDAGTKLAMANFVFDRYTPLSHVVDLYYRAGGKLFWLPKDRDRICIKGDTLMRRASLAVRRMVSFVKTGKPGIKAVVARMIYHRRADRQQKKVWLLSDRTNRGDDNGEVMFRYLCENPVEGVEPYFVIEKNTPDWQELSKIGKLVEPFSKEHKILFLLNELSLSSQANKAVINPFGKLEYYYRDLMFDKKLVFLQHGITKDNQSAWLNKYNRNLFGTVVTTKPEYDSMLEYDYYYTPERIWLTGMPRYDRLYHDEKRYITVMPTWRKHLSPGTDENGVWLIGDDFNKSDYFQFYNTLLNDEKLLAAAKQYGYTICFMPHPNTIAALHMFRKHEDVQFFDMKKSYRDVFAQTDLMVTDYSSVAFDFAYLRKPIVYSQFDRDSFFSGSHSYTEGYFNYETDGFGEVEYTLEAVRERLVEYMAADCKLKPEYEQRINRTFAFGDKDCCLRVCREIKKYL